MPLTLDHNVPDGRAGNSTECHRRIRMSRLFANNKANSEAIALHPLSPDVPSSSRLRGSYAPNEEYIMEHNPLIRNSDDTDTPPRRDMADNTTAGELLCFRSGQS